MSFVNKPGKTTTWRNRVIKQQISDVIAYDKIITTITKAKETKKHVDKAITLAKKGDLSSIRKLNAMLLDTKNMEKDKLISKLKNLAMKYANRKGGYTRVLRLGTRLGDRTEEAILSLV